MKKFAVLSLAAASLLTCGAVLAQQKMNGMGDMKSMGMDMPMKPASAAKATTHRASGVVKQVDTKASTVTLAHQPIKSLNWPAMTMGFKVKDKRLFDKLGVGAKVDVGLEQQGNDYVVTDVR
ncbi:MAG: copper-binding protein [Burkholderiaceae bacterium]